MACLCQGAMMRAEPAAAIASYLRPPAATHQQSGLGVGVPGSRRGGSLPEIKDGRESRGRSSKARLVRTSPAVRPWRLLLESQPVVGYRTHAGLLL